MRAHDPARHAQSEISLDSIDIHDRRPRADSAAIAASNSLSSLVTCRGGAEKFCEDGIPCASKTPHGEQKATKRRGWKSLTGWRLGTTTAAALTGAILLGNVTLLAVFVSQVRKDRWTANVAPVRIGDCTSIKNLGTGIHLVINIVSTLLLGASNYCMQTVSAPTRQDVDRAHRAGKWLDIGVPSVRNLYYIRPRRLLLWLFLGLTSIPLHLVYNSIFFVSTNNNQYSVWFAEESFTTGASFNKTYFEDDDSAATLQQEIMTTNVYEKLTNDECIRAYAKPLVEDRGDVVLIVDKPDENSCIFVHEPNIEGLRFPDSCGDRSPSTSLYGSFFYRTSFSPTAYDYVTNWFHWICGQEALYVRESKTDGPPANMCSNGGWKSQLGADPWMVNGNKVKHCLSKRVNSQCSLQVAFSLLGVVVAFNGIKFIVILLMATSSLVDDNPLVTLGDATASFIDHSEPITENQSFLSKKDVQKNKSFGQFTAKEYDATKLRWYTAASKTRWILAALLTASALAIILGLLGHGGSDQAQRFGRGDLKTLWDYGLGVVSPYTIIENWGIPTKGDGAVARAVLVTNLPQLLLSFLYLNFNGLVTSMTTAAEWSRFAHNHHRPLRVSFPKGEQRSTFFLQLPYRFSIPLMAFSILLHWLVSQSFFIVQILESRFGDVTDQNQNAVHTFKDFKGSTLTSAGYSPMGMILTCCVILVVYLGVCCLGILRFKSGMPLAGSCSLAISASCHTPQGTSSQLPLKWGVVSHSACTSLQGPEHCSFSNGAVEPPEPGKFYA